MTDAFQYGNLDGFKSKEIHMFKMFRSLTLTASVLTMVACSSTPHVESTGQYLDNSAITTKIKANLVDKLGSDGFAIKVKTFKNEVQLSGFVKSLNIKRRAGLIAGNASQAMHVRNDIVVK